MKVSDASDLYDVSSLLCYPPLHFNSNRTPSKLVAYRKTSNWFTLRFPLNIHAGEILPNFKHCITGHSEPPQSSTFFLGIRVIYETAYTLFFWYLLCQITTRLVLNIWYCMVTGREWLYYSKFIGLPNFNAWKGRITIIGDKWTEDITGRYRLRKTLTWSQGKWLHHFFFLSHKVNYFFFLPPPPLAFLLVSLAVFSGVSC